MKLAQWKETKRVVTGSRSGNVTRINSRNFHAATEVDPRTVVRGRAPLYATVDIMRDNKVYIAQNRESCITT